MFKITKQMRIYWQDSSGTIYIKDEHGNILTAGGNVADRWKRYFEGLLNSQNQSFFWGLESLTAVFQKFMNDGVSPLEYSISLTLPIYKQKKDALLFGIYRGLTLFEHSIKVQENILLASLKKFVCIVPQQCGFRAGRSTSYATFFTRQLQGKYSAKKKTLYHIYVDLEKAFDKSLRQAVWRECLKDWLNASACCAINPRRRSK